MRNHYADDNDIFGLYNPQKYHCVDKIQRNCRNDPRNVPRPSLEHKGCFDWGEKSGVIVFLPDDAAPLKVGQLSSYSL